MPNITQPICPNFLLVQFAEGSAGLFLTSLLATSKSVGHYDQNINKDKTDKLCLEFIKSRFTNDAEHWLLREPRPQTLLNLHFVSTRFPRGDDLTTDEFFCLCQTDAKEHFWQIAQEKKLIPMVWHKQNIPIFFKNASIVTILIDPMSYKWYHRATWYKKYGIKNSKIHIRTDDPMYNVARSAYVEKFKNEYLVDQHPFTFIKNNILKTDYKNIFKTEENFKDGCQREFITLSEILDIDRLELALTRICKKFNLDPISHELLVDAWNHWRECHDSFMPKYS